MSENMGGGASATPTAKEAEFCDNSVTPMPLLPIFNSRPTTQNSEKKLVKNIPPGFRSDPGVPPGYFEHSLNILGGKFLLLDQLEGSHLQRCIDVNTKQEFVCKVSRVFNKRVGAK